MDKVKICWIDVETTGTYHWKHSVIQIAGIIEINGGIVREFNFDIRPHPLALIEDSALKVTGKTKKEIMQYPDQVFIKNNLNVVLKEYVDPFDKMDKYFFAGYNSHFDNNFMRAFYKQTGDNFFGSMFWSGSIDVMVLALDYLKEKRPTMANFQLMEVAKTLGIDINKGKAHDALYDIRITRQIYYQLKKIQNG